MNKFILKCSLFGFFFVCSFAHSKEPYIVLWKGEKSAEYTLHEYQSDNNYFGIYQLFSEGTGGTRIYIFPDKTFAITSYCDICIGEELLAKGKYEFLNSQLKMKFSSSFEGQSEKLYFLRHGSKDKKGYSEGFEPVMFDEKQFAKSSLSKPSFDFWKQVEPFSNWQQRSLEFQQKPLTEQKQ